ncbi:hypothetical protein LIPSTDRAFT_260435 [Lipomyces starkeyi NRRL Y-11557]|uniref:Uncharacterized protein n=1 Tax=Lipomyces starkeyi NRRL Y-11557 TaxID=675824 RepID=A0A1E3Q6T4_LIPST|nr:hypothetical protein LIPSTDRAFT_260435 [Lipomyces starkeyi NRRL Y-11557]
MYHNCSTLSQPTLKIYNGPYYSNRPTAATPSAPSSAPYNLYVGMVLDSVDNAREVVKAYAIQHNFALKNGLVKNKDTTLLLLCKCALKTFNSRKLPLQKGVIGDNNLVRQKDARSMLCDCPWRDTSWKVLIRCRIR